MRLITTCIFSLLTLYSIAQEKTVFHNVNIVDVTNGKIINNQTVTIQDGIITNIEAARKNKIKNSIDLSGKYMMPGLIDSHVHWANFANERPAMDSLSKAFLRDGITTVRDVSGDAMIIKKYTEYLKKGELVGPTVYYSSFWAGKNYFDARGRDEDVTTAWNREINPGDDYEKAIIAAKESGCLGLKLYADLTYEQLVEIIKLCKKHDIKPWGHLATHKNNAMDVVRAGVEVVSHAYYFDEDKTREIRHDIYKEMIKRGTILDGTVTISEENGMTNSVIHLAEAYKAGVRLVAGTDYIAITDDGSYTSFLLHELDLYSTKCNISNADILRMATIVGAEIVCQQGKIGIIAKDAQADILILNSNPLQSLEALKNIEMMLVDGKLVK